MEVPTLAARQKMPQSDEVGVTVFLSLVLGMKTVDWSDRSTPEREASTIGGSRNKVLSGSTNALLWPGLVDSVDLPQLPPCHCLYCPYLLACLILILLPFVEH